MNPNPINRRQFFDSVQNGLYGAALASLLTRDLYGKEPHHKPALPMDTRPRQPRCGGSALGKPLTQTSEGGLGIKLYDVPMRHDDPLETPLLDGLDER